MNAPPRHVIREPAAEFFGTMILCLLGTAGNAQGVLFDSTKVSSSPAGVSGFGVLVCTLSETKFTPGLDFGDSWLGYR